MTESVLLTQPVSAPGVLLLGGAEGGLHERDARALHAEGYNVLALAYFGAPTLPPGLVDIPLEYFFAAVDKIASFAAGKIGIVGGSRGGEAALLVAAHDDRVGAVVSVAGGGLITQGIDYRAGSLLTFSPHRRRRGRCAASRWTTCRTRSATNCGSRWRTTSRCDCGWRSRTCRKT
ncbi:dienelactone hydrolase family protein [Kutzneria kofuensis]|uniref:dienelactone hydrolase family protein n=1 Tax=Kutzneria kofuensis TaxID=103725 RepID=UPI0031EB99AF